jgi:hypothetical protein
MHEFEIYNAKNLIVRLILFHMMLLNANIRLCPFLLFQTPDLLYDCI